MSRFASIADNSTGCRLSLQLPGTATTAAKRHQVRCFAVVPTSCCCACYAPAGKEQSVRIQSSGGLSEEAIQQMVREAESHAEKDKQRKALIEVSGGRGGVVSRRPCTPAHTMAWRS